MKHETPKAGDNQPPASEAFSMAIDDLYAEAKNHLDGADIENEAQANDLTAILDGMKELARDAEKTRKAEKEPFLQAGREVDARWKEPIGKAKLVIAEAAKPLTVWRQKLQAAADAKAKALREQAIENERKAQEARNAASSLEEAEQAEAMIEQASIEKKTANKIARAPTGLRTYWEAEIVDHGKLLAHIKQTNPDWLKGQLNEYAGQQVRATKMDMPGVIAHERKRAA